MTRAQACIPCACAICKHPACHACFVQASSSSTLFIGSLCPYLDVFGLTHTCSTLLMAALPPACLHAYESKVECLTSHQPFVKHLISVDLICSLAVSGPSLATAHVLECQFWLTTFSNSRSICSLCLVTICVSGCRARYTALRDLIDNNRQRHSHCHFELASRACIFCHDIKHVLQGSSLLVDESYKRLCNRRDCT